MFVFFWWFKKDAMEEYDLDFTNAKNCGIEEELKTSLFILSNTFLFVSIDLENNRMREECGDKASVLTTFSPLP